MKSNYKNKALCAAMLLLLLTTILYNIFNPEKAIAQLNRLSNAPPSTAPVIEKLAAQPISSGEFWNKIIKLIATDNGYITPGELEKTFGFRFTHAEHIGELATQYTVVPNSNWRVPITLTMFSAASIGVGGLHSGLDINLRPNPWFYGCENYRDLYPILIS